MSVFGSIVSAIFGHGSIAKAAAGAGSSTAQSTGMSSAPPPASAASAAAKPVPMTREEVDAMIEKIADAQDEEYNWEESIVDLMKLLKLDSSLTARKQLAQELGYKGELNGSAEMNIWLHEQVMAKLAESGGAVPDSLKHG
jgi:Domain of unknown function (DUF3597)